MLQPKNITEYFIKNYIITGDIAIDATAGNGNDTLRLCKAVGKSGFVYAFDIQKEALENTEARLKESGVTASYKLVLDSHANAKNYIEESIDAGMFNLGYRPGGNKSVHTMRESTLPAVRNAIDMLKKGGILVISVYPGQDEGRIEGEMLLEMLAEYDKKLYCVSHFHLVNSPDAPFVIAVEKYNKQ